MDAYRNGGSSDELAKVREKAQQLAKGDSAGDGDPIRVLAELVHQLAMEVERLALRSPDDGLTTPLMVAPED